MNRLTLAALLGLLALPAAAQYKVVGPDGRVTYTDRPPAASAAGQVSAVRRDASPSSSGTPLPLELRQAAARFPVVLFTASDCPPCETARAMLKRRGIPLTERRVTQPDDLATVERLTGGRALPGLTVGSQSINGYGESQWNSLLDLAGYPRESRLPAGYVAAAPVPITPPAPAVPVPAQSPSLRPTPPSELPPPPVSEPGTPGIRF